MPPPRVPQEGLVTPQPGPLAASRWGDRPARRPMPARLAPSRQACGLWPVPVTAGAGSVAGPGESTLCPDTGWGPGACCSAAPCRAPLCPPAPPAGVGRRGRCRRPTRRPAPLGPAPVPAALTSAARQELQAPTGYPGVCGAQAYPRPPQGCTPENCSVAAAEPGASQSPRTQPVGRSCGRLQPCPGSITGGQGPCPGRPNPPGFQLCRRRVFGQVGLAVGQPAGVPSPAVTRDS